MAWQSASAWLPFLPMEVPGGRTPEDIARSELKAGLSSLQYGGGFDVRVTERGDAYTIDEVNRRVVVTGGDKGVLYGAYEALMRIARGQSPAKERTQPQYALRMLNHWDNMNGTVERGYAGASLFFDSNKISYQPERIHRYARMLASVGINTVCLNNVNVYAPADRLVMPDMLPQLAALSDILRPYGIRLLISVDFSLPLRGAPGTADPCDPAVASFWARQTDLVYSAIPDLAGFVVKADSESRPGPYAYGRDHADGANMLARALKKHGGVLVWRCFVYNCQQDWRDPATDRPMAAYTTFAPLDGRFDDNVILQIKNGPYDFQVREPVSPLLLALKKTRMAMEVQLAQEYTGHQIDLFYMARLWKDVFDVLPRENLSAVCAVANLGSDETWAGHDLALANTYAYGRMAWSGQSDPEALAREWAALSYPKAQNEIVSLLLRSHGAYEKYTAPLGLCWMVNPGVHYGPSPEGYEFSVWGTYHRANHEAVGIDRSGRGTGYAQQYPSALATLYDDPATCPDELLLFFHRVRYDFVMKDGRTLLQRIYDDHFEGAEEAERMRRDWQALKGRVPEDVFARVGAKFDLQVKNAREWRDVVNTYFYRHTGVADGKGRMIYP